MTPKTKKDEMALAAFYYVCHYKYAYGAKRRTGVMTQSVLDRLATDSPNMYTQAYKAKTAKNLGSLVIDCSGLVCDLWNIADIGSSQIHDLPNTQPRDYKYVPLSRNILMWGDCLWKVGHVGMYMGDGIVVEAKGVDAGVRISKLEDTNWNLAIRKKSLHVYERIGWGWDSFGDWYSFGESYGEYYSNCILRPDAISQFWKFDKNGYAKIYKED